MSHQVAVIHHRVLKLKDNPFTRPALSPIWLKAIRRFRRAKHKTQQCHGNCWGGWRPPVAVRNCWWSATSKVTTARCCLYMSVTLRRAQQGGRSPIPLPQSRLFPGGRAVDARQNRLWLTAHVRTNAVGDTRFARWKCSDCFSERLRTLQFACQLSSQLYSISADWFSQKASVIYFAKHFTWNYT